ncbi:hypothetical protein NKH24_35635, partial [Mesorhizobium sp. M1300]|uniref:hypothetical protein n=1 Tax=Mesorhizobium sp. M1300 TaxID=2957077 RepID=UPI003336DFA7
MLVLPLSVAALEVKTRLSNLTVPERHGLGGYKGARGALHFVSAAQTSVYFVVGASTSGIRLSLSEAIGDLCGMEEKGGGSGHAVFMSAPWMMTPAVA